MWLSARGEPEEVLNEVGPPELPPEVEKGLLPSFADLLIFEVAPVPSIEPRPTFFSISY